MTAARAARVVYGARTEHQALRRAKLAERIGLETLAEALFVQAMAIRARHYPESRRLYEGQVRALLAEVAT